MAAATPPTIIDSNDDLLELASLDSIPIEQLFQQHDESVADADVTSSPAAAAAVAQPLFHLPSIDTMNNDLPIHHGDSHWRHQYQQWREPDELTSSSTSIHSRQ
jgi:hypothetical protein